MPSKSSQRSGQRPIESKEKLRQQSLKKSPRKSSGHHKDHSLQGNTNSNISPQHNPSSQQASWGYHQTAATHNSTQSQYQATSLPGLPSATTWPNGYTVPSQTRLSHDLLGLSQDFQVVDYSVYPASTYGAQSLECPYHRTVHQTDFAGEGPGTGLGGLDRFLAEGRSFQGAVYFAENVSNRVGGCCYVPRL